MNEFLTWEMLMDYSTLITMVFIIVEFTKSIPYIKLIPTKYWSAIVSFALLLLVNLHGGTFVIWDVALYAFNAIIISLSANGLSDFDKKTVTKF